MCVRPAPIASGVTASGRHLRPYYVASIATSADSKNFANSGGSRSCGLTQDAIRRNLIPRREPEFWAQPWGRDGLPAPALKSAHRSRAPASHAREEGAYIPARPSGTRPSVSAYWADSTEAVRVSASGAGAAWNPATCAWPSTADAGRATGIHSEAGRRRAHLQDALNPGPPMETLIVAVRVLCSQLSCRRARSVLFRLDGHARSRVMLGCPTLRGVVLCTCNK